MNKLFSFLLLSIFFLFVISFSSQIITSVKIAPLGVDLKQEDESSTVPSEADVEDQFEVEKCNASLAKKCSAKQSGFRKGFTKCWFGTTEKNIYCCNQTKLGDRKPGRNDLFAPSNCCVPNGGKCFSGTLCCGNGCTKQGIPVPSALGVCSKSAPNDHTEINFRPCDPIIEGNSSVPNAAVCRVNSIKSKRSKNKCFEGVSPPSAGGPELIATTCCDPKKLKGKVPDKDEFVQPRSCCLPLGGLCLFSDTCCSAVCGGLENSNQSGFCGYPNGSFFTPTGVMPSTNGLNLLDLFDLTST